MMNQQTLAAAFTLSGFGIHTGRAARVTVHPAPPDAGRRFVLGDVEIPARSEFVLDTRRCTTLGREGDPFSSSNSGGKLLTVEHLLSALSGLGIDNAWIEVEGPELPILDGSALPYVEAIYAVGIATQDRPAAICRVRDEVVIRDGASEITIQPADQFELEVAVEFETWPEGRASVSAVIGAGQEASYAQQVAPARTFAFRVEVEQLLAAGLAKGGSLDNALVITPPDGFSTPLRLPKEWAVHKLLDLVGDLALLDARPQMRVKALRPGHTINTTAARQLAQFCLQAAKGGMDE